MIVLKILGIVLLILFSMTLVNIKARLKLKDSKIIVKAYLGFIGYTVFDSEHPPEKQEVAEKEKEPEPDKKEEKPKEKRDTKENLQMVMDLVHSSKKSLNTIRKHLKFTGICADIIVAGEDAHQTALSYGTHVTAITNGLAVLGAIFKVKIKKISIQPNFLLDKSVYNCDGVVKIRIIWILIAAFYIAKTMLVSILKNKKRKGGIKHEPATN